LSASESLSQEWYSNKQLFEMMQGLGKEIGALRTELRETTTKIRDYNGLRDDVHEYCKEVQALRAEVAGKDAGSKDTRVNIYSVISLVIAVSSILVAIVALVRG
jgi:hypothetical protein